jgi:hypothetical protein
VNDDLETIWKEAVVAYFKVIPQSSLGGSGIKYEKLRLAGLHAEI